VRRAAVLAAIATASAPGVAGGDPAPATPAIDAAAFVPGAFSPRVDGGWAQLSSGYDSALSSLRASIALEARLADRIAVRGAVIHTSRDDRQRPFVAVRAQLLGQERHAVDGALILSYEPDGFREAEGKVSAGVQVGRRWSSPSIASLGEITYSQDPEGDDRLIAAQAAALAGAGTLAAGVAGRVRADLFSDDVRRVGRHEPDLEIAVGPVATYAWRALVVAVQIGPSATVIDEVEGVRYGGFATGSVGAVF